MDNCTDKPDLNVRILVDNNSAILSTICIRGAQLFLDSKAKSPESRFLNGFQGGGDL